MIFLYVLANGIMIFNDGVFWDDWCLYNMSFDGIMSQFNGNGGVVYGYLHYVIQQAPNPTLIYTGLTLFTQIAIAMIVLKTSKLLKLNQSVFYIITLLATIAPLFMAKNTMICFPSLLNCFIFFLALYTLVLSLIKTNILLRVLALALFFFSFFVNSLLVFYLLPFAITYLFYSKINLPGFKFQNLYKINFRSIFKMTDLILLPFLFAIIKNIFFLPTGLYAENYNKISVQSIIESPMLMLRSFINQTADWIELVQKYIFIDFNHFLIFSILLLITTFGLKKLKLNFSAFTHTKILFSVGIILVVLATIPYVFVQKPPSFIGYNTRHQLLLPLGFSMTLIASIIYVTKVEILPFIFSLVLATNIALCFNINLQFIKGGLKQQSLVLNFRLNSEIENNNTFIYSDNTANLDATKDEFRYYSLNGISKLAFGAENRLICDENTYHKFMNGNGWDDRLVETEMYNMSDYKFGKVDAYIDVNQGSYDLGIFNTFQLLYWKKFDKNKAWTATKNILKVNTNSNIELPKKL